MIIWVVGGGLIVLGLLLLLLVKVSGVLHIRAGIVEADRLLALGEDATFEEFIAWQREYGSG